jgi:hypothetical protein
MQERFVSGPYKKRGPAKMQEVSEGFFKEIVNTG